MSSESLQSLPVTTSARAPDAARLFDRLSAKLSDLSRSRSNQPGESGDGAARSGRRALIRPTVIRRTAIGRAVILGTVGVAVSAAIGVPLTMRMMARAPSWWRSIDPRSAATIRVGTDLENQIVEIMRLVRPSAKPAAGSPPGPGAYQSEPWTIAIRAADANAWVNARLPKWVASQGPDSATSSGQIALATKSKPRTFAWPEQVEQVQVEFARGMIHVGARIRESTSQVSRNDSSKSAARIVSASLVPELAADGSLWMRAEGVGVGSLPLPTSLLLSSASAGNMVALPRELRDLPETAALLRAFTGDTPLTVTPTLTLGDGRRVRVLAIRSEDGLLILTCRTERK